MSEQTQKTKYKAKPQDIVFDFLKTDNLGRDLLYCEETKDLWKYSGGWWQKISEEKLITEIYQFCLLAHPDQRIDDQFSKNIYSSLRHQILTSVPSMDSDWITFRDLSFNPLTQETKEHSRDLYSTHYINCNYIGLTDECPIWRKFLDTSIVQKSNTKIPDTELQTLVQEMFGYFLIANPEMGQVAFFLVGEGANGKSKLLKVLREIIGSQFISSSSLEMLTSDKFGLPSLIGKKVNICNEEESKHIRVDKFKALISGDPVGGQYKFGAHFEYIPKVKFVFATNNIPTFNDLNYATIRRIKIIPFNRRFKETDADRDPRIFDKIKPEIPGIVKWALDGAKRLIENEFVFSRAKQSVLASEEFTSEISSAVRFFTDNYQICTCETTHFIPNDDLYRSYKAWCEENGKKPLSSFNFHRDIMATTEGIITPTRSFDGMTKRCKNIELKNPEDDDPGVSIDDIDF